MKNICIYIIVIILIICIIYLLIPKDSRCRKRYRKHYKKSNGTFDIHAKKTLKEIINIKEPKIDDEFILGDIIGLNILEGNLTKNPILTVQTYISYGNTLNRILNNERPDKTEENIPDRQFMVDRITDFKNRIIEDDVTDIIVLPLEPFDNMLHETKNKIKI